LLRIVGTRKAEKNNFLIDVYEFTWAGLCLFLLLHYKGIDKPFMEICVNVVGAFATYLAIQRSRITRFAADLYSKSAGIEECGKAIIDLLSRMLHDDDSAVLNQYLSEFLHGIIYLLLTHREITPSFFENVFKEALFKLDEETRALILQDMKLKVENEIIQMGAPEDYERLWFANIHIYSKLVLYGARHIFARRAILMIRSYSKYYKAPS